MELDGRVGGVAHLFELEINWVDLDYGWRFSMQWPIEYCVCMGC
jgi:hypothetical protein